MHTFVTSAWTGDICYRRLQTVRDRNRQHNLHSGRTFLCEKIDTYNVLHFGISGMDLESVDARRQLFFGGTLILSK